MSRTSLRMKSRGRVSGADAARSSTRLCRSRTWSIAIPHVQLRKKSHSLSIWFSCGPASEYSGAWVKVGALRCRLCCGGKLGHDVLPLKRVGERQHARDDEAPARIA